MPTEQLVGSSHKRTPTARASPQTTRFPFVVRCTARHSSDQVTQGFGQLQALYKIMPGQSSGLTYRLSSWEWNGLVSIRAADPIGLPTVNNEALPPDWAPCTCPRQSRLDDWRFFFLHRHHRQARSSLAAAEDVRYKGSCTVFSTSVHLKGLEKI